WPGRATASPLTRGPLLLPLLPRLAHHFLPGRAPGLVGRRAWPFPPLYVLQQRQLQDLLHPLDEMELHRLARLLGDIAQVALVPSGQDDAMDPGAVRGEDLLLHAADLEHLPPQRYFARHGDVVPDGAVRERGGDGEGHGDPGGGAVLRNRADGEVDVDVVVLERALGDVELVA